MDTPLASPRTNPNDPKEELDLPQLGDPQQPDALETFDAPNLDHKTEQEISAIVTEGLDECSNCLDRHGCPMLSSLARSKTCKRIGILIGTLGVAVLVAYLYEMVKKGV